MAAGEITQGRRRPADSKPWELDAGDYCLRNGELWVCLPSGVGPAKLEDWDVTWHEDDTVTASPSIHDVGSENGWHGFLERGVWREC